MALPDEHPSDERRERRAAAGVAALFGVIAILAGADIAADLAEGTTAPHVLAEALVVAIGLVGLAVMVRRFAALARRERQLAARAIELSARLDQTNDEARRWRDEARELLRGLGASIDEQLDRWELTPAEKEVALLLLKGLSLKELAAVREVGEATARQQARAVYRKANLSGRSELAAFFLEDLLQPPPEIRD